MYNVKSGLINIPLLINLLLLQFFAILKQVAPQD